MMKILFKTFEQTILFVAFLNNYSELSSFTSFINEAKCKHVYIRKKTGRQQVYILQF